MKQELSKFGDTAVASLQSNVWTPETFNMEGRYHVVCHDKDGNFKWEDIAENQVTQAGKIFMFSQLLQTSIALVGPYLGLVTSTGTLVTAGSFVTGATYQITSVGTTTFTAIGASANTVGIVFTATGAGSGTGTATLIGTFSPTDTMASHAGWTEFVNYTYSSSGVRGTATFSTPTGNASTTAGGNIVTAAAGSLTFNITSSGGAVGGCFLVTGTGATNVFSATTGTMYSAGAFTGGPKTTSSGDSLAVTYSTTATS
jgi:hypothetical protein